MSIKDFTQKIKLFLSNIKDKTYSQEKGLNQSEGLVGRTNPNSGLVLGLKIKNDLYMVILIALVGTASYGLGKISSLEKNKTPISVLKTQEYMLTTASESVASNIKTNNNIQTINTNPSGEVVASKSGTKYYYPWCSGVSRIKEENKIWFESIEKARSAGLTPASNCTGLK